ncbi:MAG: lipocalin-like domain-containing protein [Chloroflexota bacterium]
MHRTRCWGLIVALVLSAACARPSSPLPAAPAPSPTLAQPIALPRDGGPHDALTEWWYFTGHLQSDQDGSLYGFEFTIFQAQRQGSPTGYLAHFAVSDIGGQRFSHQARTAQTETGGPPSHAAALQPDGVTSAEPSRAVFPLDVGGWRLSTDGGTDSIVADMQAGPGADPPFGVQLQLVDEKPPALHNGGYIEYGIPGGSYYYSRTRLNVRGQLSQAGGDPVSVSGVAWMDHQWGNFVVGAVGGWDWYSLQLDDRSELMLYVLRAPSGETTGVYGTQVLADGTSHDLGAGSVRTEATGSWTSPHTGGVYPSGWLLTLPSGEKLEVRPQLQDQELFFPRATPQTADASGAAPGSAVPAYWEGAVTVSGDRTGLGYVELTGYTHP